MYEPSKTGYSVCSMAGIRKNVHFRTFICIVSYNAWKFAISFIPDSHLRHSLLISTSTSSSHESTKRNVLFFTTHRGKLKFEISFIPDSHLFQSLLTSIGTSSFHKSPKRHNSCIINFGCKTNGCMKPSGSKIRL